MEGNYLTSGDLALMENHRGGYGYGYGDFYGGCCHRGNYGASTTGVALGASALGVAVIGALAIGWGVNQASKARARGAEQLNAALSNNLNQLASLAIAERTSRESWQNMHAPTITQYTDVRTGAGALSGAGANALANASAEALALNALLNNNGHNGQTCPQPVALYQPAMPCRCNTCGD